MFFLLLYLTGTLQKKEVRDTGTQFRFLRFGFYFCQEEGVKVLSPCLSRELMGIKHEIILPKKFILFMCSYALIKKYMPP